MSPCKECWNMFQGRCDNCGRIKLGTGSETNENKDREQQREDLRGDKNE